MKPATRREASPRPWRVGLKGGVESATFNPIAATFGNHANADLIVRAVNAHERLVEFARYVEGLDNEDFDPPEKVQPRELAAAIRRVAAKARALLAEVSK